MAETRTPKQIDADILDMDMNRLVSRLERFAATHKEPEVERAAVVLYGLRRELRKHMCKKDLEATA